MKIFYCIENTIELDDNLSDEEINEKLDEITQNKCTSWWKEKEDTSNSLIDNISEF